MEHTHTDTHWDPITFTLASQQNINIRPIGMLATGCTQDFCWGDTETHEGSKLPSQTLWQRDWGVGVWMEESKNPVIAPVSFDPEFALIETFGAPSFFFHFKGIQ